MLKWCERSMKIFWIYAKQLSDFLTVWGLNTCSTSGRKVELVASAFAAVELCTRTRYSLLDSKLKSEVWIHWTALKIGNT